jgi:hypothetical protein
MAKFKIRTPVVIKGKLHHKIGSVVEVTDEESKTLAAGGWGEKVNADTPADKGVTIDASAIKEEKEKKAKE